MIKIQITSYKYIIAFLCSTSLMSCSSTVVDESAEILFCGQIQSSSSTQVESSKAFRLIAEANHQDVALQVLSNSVPSRWETVWTGDVGQTHVTSISSRYFPGVGYVLAVEAADGASSLRLVLLRISSSEQWSLIFDGKAKFGHNILDVDGDGTSEIVQVSGDLFSTNTVTIFAWDGFGFVRRSVETSKLFPHYKIVFDSKQ